MSKIDKLLQAALPHLESGEPASIVVMGAYECKIMKNKTVRTGIFIATDRRIIFYGTKMFGYDMEVFPYSNISSIETGKGLMGHTIGFFASGNKVEMKWINSPNVNEFIQLVKSKIGKKNEAAPTIQQNNDNNVAEQIRKLAQLRDEGILTEDEFNTKKLQLLGI